ncbi:MAG: GerMN domain-containing protein [Gammaproteobacteria bacterium]|nr:GerMN domain-containing protein [Gammaproteobacteria bacterium]
MKLKVNKYALFWLLLLSPVPVLADSFRIWEVFYDKVTDRDLLRPKEVSVDKKPTPQIALDILLKDYKEIKVKVMLVKHGIAYVNIEQNPEHITENSGTTGAYHFAAVVVFTLTELKEIEKVYFVDEGSHFGTGGQVRLYYWELMSDYRRSRYKQELEESAHINSSRLYSIVEKLADVGDAGTLKQLHELKLKCSRKKSCCDGDTLDEAIKKLENRLGAAK